MKVMIQKLLKVNIAALQVFCIFIQIFTLSHAKERTQKNCLNCNAEVMGRYCQVCGQENIETHETFWQLTTHLVYDIVHFDGKFFSTLKSLLFKPGFLTHEYIRGKRASYLHPVRMYVFTSTIFFIIFFAFIVPADKINSSGNLIGNSKAKDIVKDSVIKKISDSAGINIKDPVMHKSDFNGNDILPPSIEAYDSIQKTLPETKRDGWFTQMISKRSIIISNKYKGNQEDFIKDLFENFLHSLPKMMFISLPLAALLLQLLYIRRKQFLYVQHGVFLIHVYIATYILFLLQYGLKALNDILHWSIIGYLSGFTVFLIFFYLYKAMRNFYGQRRAKTIFKFFLFNCLYFIVLGLLTALFFTTSLFEI